jgi:putative ABC transport system ATP-binding protein
VIVTANPSSATSLAALETPLDSIITLDAVHKHYIMGDNVVKALDGVDLHFERGGFYAIMGSSGSGKSTMLNLIGCLDRPTSGTYTLENRNISTLDDNELSDLRLKYIGFIFQSFNLIPQLTVRENIELPLFYQQISPEERTRRAEILAADVGLVDRLGHRPTELSGGQMQRVAIARALANNPSLLLADEPTGNLDSRTGAQVMEILEGLYEAGKTLIMVTHEPEIAAHARTVVHMKDGNVERVESGRS